MSLTTLLFTFASCVYPIVFIHQAPMVVCASRTLRGTGGKVCISHPKSRKIIEVVTEAFTNKLDPEESEQLAFRLLLKKKKTRS